MKDSTSVFFILKTATTTISPSHGSTESPAISWEQTNPLNEDIQQPIITWKLKRKEKKDLSFDIGNTVSEKDTSNGVEETAETS